MRDGLKTAIHMGLLTAVGPAAPLIAGGLAAAVWSILTDSKDADANFTKATRDWIVGILGNLAAEGPNSLAEALASHTNHDIEQLTVGALSIALEQVRAKHHLENSLPINHLYGAEWFDRWKRTLAAAGKDPLSAATLFYTDEQPDPTETDPAVWWLRFRTLLERWAWLDRGVDKPRQRLPEPLAELLSKELSQYFELQQDLRVRQPKHRPEWIAYQQRFFRKLASNLETGNAEASKAFAVLADSMETLREDLATVKNTTSETREISERTLLGVKQLLDRTQTLAAMPHEDLPQPIRAHLTELRGHAYRRLGQLAHGVVSTKAHVDDQFVTRFGKDSDGAVIELLSYVWAAAQQHGSSSEKIFDRLLVLARAGDGKTTLVHSLLCMLAEDTAVRQTKLIPMLADCVTLSSSFSELKSWNDTVQRWLSLAVSPSGSIGRTQAGPHVEAFLHSVRDVAREGFRVLLLIDGLDEMEPSGIGCQRIEGLLEALRNWWNHAGIPVTLLATSRAGDEIRNDPRVEVAGKFGLRPIELLPPGSEAIRALAARKAAELSPCDRGAVLDRLVEVFQGPSLQSKLVYLPLLIRYAMAQPNVFLTESITSIVLMRDEMRFVIRKLQAEISDRNPGMDGWCLEEDLMEVLLEIAVHSITSYDRGVPGSIAIKELAELDSVRAVRGLEKLIDNRSIVVNRLLNVLIFERRIWKQGRPVDVAYRLPHNEYRDYLLAEGLFRWILTAPRLAGPLRISQATTPLRRNASEKFINDLACGYRRAERVKDFLKNLIAETASDEGKISPLAFAENLARRMNELPGRIPEERSDVSPHGALLSLLLELGVMPSEKVRAQGRCFQGTKAPAGKGTRFRMPLEKDCREAVFRESDLSGADFSCLDLPLVDFDNAILLGASFERANLQGSNLRNAAMGSDGKYPTDFRGALLDDSDWFNYRLSELQGFFNFWDLELVGNDRFVLTAGSRGQLLLFDMAETALRPFIIQTRHVKDVIDLSGHPSKNLVVTTSRDGTVGLYSVPEDVAQWCHEHRNGLAILTGKQLPTRFPKSNYPRRSQFSATGRWLAIIARDSRIAVIGFDEHREQGAQNFGYGHTGPVMCLVADSEDGVETFFTAGYDGRVARWREDCCGNPVWSQPLAMLETAVKAGGKTEILRSLAPNAGRSGLWAGTELDGRLLLFRFSGEKVSIQTVRPFEEGGVFSLAVHERPSLLAVGLSNGRVKVFRAPQNAPDEYDWNNPLVNAETTGDIVRSLVFVQGGRELLAATWDGCLFRYDLATGKEVARYEYPEEQWRPADDNAQFRFSQDQGPLEKVRGVSPRMKGYLSQVARL